MKAGLNTQLFEVTKVIEQALKNTKMMFVGDDWQAINRFSGADVNLFIQLKKHYCISQNML